MKRFRFRLQIRDLDKMKNDHQITYDKSDHVVK